MMLKQTQFFNAKKWRSRSFLPSKPSICRTQLMVEVVPHFGTSPTSTPGARSDSGPWTEVCPGFYRGTVRKATGTCLGQWNNCTFTGQTSTEGVLEVSSGRRWIGGHISQSLKVDEFMLRLFSFSLFINFEILFLVQNTASSPNECV